MLRQRILFELVYADGWFHQSRNFRLQKVGKLDWLLDNYRFEIFSDSIDELIVIDASRAERDMSAFCHIIRSLARNLLMPISVGGSLYNRETAEEYFVNGADKVIVNTAIFENPSAVLEMVDRFGSQSVLGCCDYRIVDGVSRVFYSGASKDSGLGLAGYMKIATDLGLGELIINSVDRDGTGFGLDLDTLNGLNYDSSIPLIALGGAGKELHFSEALRCPFISAVATANLFNFIGDGLADVRRSLERNGFNLARRYPDV